MIINANAQPDNQFVKGIKGNLAAKQQKLKHVRPDYIKKGYN